MLVQLLKLGEDEIVTTFSPGGYELGRGSTLQCNDKRVSRNHARIEINQNVTLTSTHINPCFIRSSGSKTIRILKKDKSEELNDGDSFALLPEDFWFKIKIIEDNLDTENKKITLKRLSCDNGEDVPPDKKLKVEENEEISKPDEKIEKKAAKSTIKDEIPKDATVTNSRIIEDILESEVKEGLTEHNENQDNPQTNIATEKVQEVTENSNEASTSRNVKDIAGKPLSPKPRREKCWYAHECYRKNPQHRDDFSHPGDSDFESDSEDNRPTCSFGAKCYRKNREHRQKFKHPPKQSPVQKKRNRKKVNRLNAATSEEINELLDSETEDPFVDDGDSDEYTGESEEDSDWQDDGTDEECEKTSERSNKICR